MNCVCKVPSIKSIVLTLTNRIIGLYKYVLIQSSEESYSENVASGSNLVQASIN